MATATNKTTAATEIPELAQKAREQLLSTVQQSQQLSIDAAQAWVKAVSVIPVPDLPALPGLSTLPGLPNIPSVEAATTFTFDLAADLLSSQRDFALQLATMLVPAKSN